LETPGFSSGEYCTSRPESVTAPLNFLRIVCGRVEDQHRALLGAAGRRHLLRRLLQVHDPRAHLREDALWQLERVAEARVEALRDIARELDVLTLVVADRDDVGLVEQDVTRHEDGVREEGRQR